jgi:hypothetical protein
MTNGWHDETTSAARRCQIGRVFARCCIADDRLISFAERGEHLFDFLTPWSLARAACYAKCTRVMACPILAVRVGREIVAAEGSEEGVEVWPNPPPKPQKIKDKDAEHLEKLPTDGKSDAPRPKKPKRNGPAVPRLRPIRVVPPETDGAKSGDSGDVSDNESGCTGSDADPEVSDPGDGGDEHAGDGAEEHIHMDLDMDVHDAPPVPAPHSRHESRQNASSGFVLSQLTHHSLPAGGWSIKCGRHTDPALPDLVCRKQVWCNKRNDVLSDEQCIAGLKRWHILGHSIDDEVDAKGKSGRYRHMSLDVRRLAKEPLEDEDDLDEMLLLISS